MNQNSTFLLVALVLAGGLWLYSKYFSTARQPHQRPAGTTSPANRRVEQTDAEWRAALAGSQYRILRERGTEWAGSSELNHEHRPGMFVCAGCRNPLFASKTKFDSGTGWPSFYAPIVPNAVYDEPDGGRTEVRCAVCDGHLGHVFSDGPAPTGLRYCMNGAAMEFLSGTN